MTNRRYLIGIIVIFIVVAGVVFTLIFDRPDEPIPTADRTEKSEPLSTVKGAAVNLYFTDKDGLFLTAESRIVPHAEDPAIRGRNIIEALIKGPAKGLARTMPAAAAKLDHIPSRWTS